MLYIKEIIFRFQYYILSFFFTFFVTYFYKKILFVLLTFPLITFSNHYFLDKANTFSNFIYTHPAELLTIHFFLMFLVGLVFEVPYLFWHFIDFLKTSLLSKEYKKLSNFFLFFTISLVLLNLFFYFVLFPKFWFFFQNFNFSSESQTLHFFLELRVQDYFKFVLDFLYIVNILIFIFYLLTFFILFFGLEKFIYWKKLFIFINIVFATLLSPPDVYSQLVILVILTVFLELVVFFNVYYYKIYNKIFLIRHHIK